MAPKKIQQYIQTNRRSRDTDQVGNWKTDDD